jgi:23S rRNA pseudouridine1911/1915/1917 synthase
VHLTHIGYPLIGDASYGRSRQTPRAKTPAEAAAYEAIMNFPRQALHATLLGFQHPSLHKTLRFESKWPEDLSGLIATLRRLR